MFTDIFDLLVFLVNLLGVIFGVVAGSPVVVAFAATGVLCGLFLFKAKGRVL